MNDKKQRVNDKDIQNNIFIDNPFSHFKNRYESRHHHILGAHHLNMQIYINEWVRNMRGSFAGFDKKGRMIRVLGKYNEDDQMFKVIYTKIESLDIYVPLTLFEIVEHKKKYNLYKRILKTKKAR